MLDLKSSLDVETFEAANGLKAPQSFFVSKFFVSKFMVMLFSSFSMEKPFGLNFQDQENNKFEL